MKTVLFAVLLSGVFSLEHPCGPKLVPVPKDFESFDCLTTEELEHLEQHEATKRFDAEASTRFFLWTQQTKEGEREELKLNAPGSIQNSSFNASNPTRILIHGWRTDWSSESVDGLAKAYVAKGAYNVIGIDWSAGSSTILYFSARNRVQAVGSALAKQISLLLLTGHKPEQIVLIGHSLGAHVAGMTGKHFQGDSKLAAIIALDPAGPLFSADKPAERVDRNDAQYVEVIHTNMGLLGHQATLGQADFFPNGGRFQSGCLTNTCNHHRAIEYLHKSLESASALFIAHRCETESVNDKCGGTRAVMGSDIDDSYKLKTSGVFYLKIAH